MQINNSELAEFARRLRSVRLAFAGAIDLPGLSPAEFAHMLGLAPGSYEAFEQGAQEPPMSLLAVLHRRTGVSLDWLIAHEGASGEGIRHSAPHTPRAALREAY